VRLSLALLVCTSCAKLIGIQPLAALDGGSADAPIGSTDAGRPPKDATFHADAPPLGGSSYTLTVIWSGSGTVTVDGSACASSPCHLAEQNGHVVTIEADVNLGWVGCPVPTANTCSFAMQANTTVYTLFADGSNAHVIVDVEGAPPAAVTQASNTFNAGTITDLSVPDGSPLGFNATGAALVGWWGDCASNRAGAPCSITASKSKLTVVVATFVDGPACSTTSYGRPGQDQAFTVALLGAPPPTPPAFALAGANGTNLFVGVGATTYQPMSVPGDKMTALVGLPDGTFLAGITSFSGFHCGQTITPTAGGTDIYLVQFAADLGSCNVVAHYGTQMDDTITSIEVDPNNSAELVFTGAAQPGIDFGGSKLADGTAPVAYAVRISTPTPTVSVTGLWMDVDNPSEGEAVAIAPAPGSIYVAGVRHGADDDAVLYTLAPALTSGAATVIGAPGVDDRANAVAVADFVYVGGDLGDATVPIGDDVFPSLGGVDGFIAAYAKGDGSYVGARRFGGSGPDSIRALAPAPMGGARFAGRAAGSFFSSAGSSTS
jgi:hypothetical protein